MIYSSPSEFRLEGRRYLKIVPATLKFWGLSMAELPLKKKCPDSSVSASKREKRDKCGTYAEHWGCTGTEESQQLMAEKSPIEKELQALQCSSSASGQISSVQRLLLSPPSPARAQMSSEQGLSTVSLVSECPSCSWLPEMW